MREDQADYSIDTATGKRAPAHETIQRTRAIFSHIARRYDRFNAISSLGTYKIWLNGLIKSCPAHRNSQVLDVAGGTGAVSFALARAKHPARIECTDLVPEMLEVAKERNRTLQERYPDTQINFQVVDAQDIPYPNNSFDCVTMAYGIRNIPNRTLALKEILRVLKPGGTLSCLEFSRPQNPVWRGLYHVYLNHVMPNIGQLVCHEREGFIYLNKSICAFPDQREFAELLEQVGFKDVAWKNYSGGIAAVHTAAKPKESFEPASVSMHASR